MIISLGSNCAIAWQLKCHNLRKETYPFDWSKITLKQLINVLQNNFKDYTKLQVKKLSDNHKYFQFENNFQFEHNFQNEHNFQFEHNFQNESSYILYNNYNITFAHELIDKNNIDELSSIIDRRVERFKLLNNVTFIRIETCIIKDINNEKQAHLENESKIEINNIIVENVLIISAIEQYNPLYKFEIYNFRIIVERAKDLLNNLYTRVVQSDVSSSDEIVKFQPSNIYG